MWPVLGGSIGPYCSAGCCVLVADSVLCLLCTPAVLCTVPAVLCACCVHLACCDLSKSSLNPPPMFGMPSCLPAASSFFVQDFLLLLTGTTMGRTLQEIIMQVGQGAVAHCWGQASCDSSGISSATGMAAAAAASY